MEKLEYCRTYPQKRTIGTTLELSKKSKKGASPAICQMTPIQSKINEIEQEKEEFGDPLHTTLWELQMIIREYAEEKGLGSYSYKGGQMNNVKNK